MTIDKSCVLFVLDLEFNVICEKWYQRLFEENFGSKSRFKVSKDVSLEFRNNNNYSIKCLNFRK